MRKVWHFVGTALTAFVLVAGAVVLLGGVLVPRIAGATTYAVLADSMAPRYPTGTLMVVRPVDTISTGDIITYQSQPNDPMVVTHRVVGVGSTITGEPRFTTRGDANEIADPVLVQPEQIRGALWYAIPYAGFLVMAMGNWREPATLGIAGLLTGYALYQLIRSVVERLKPLAAAPVDVAAQADAVAPVYPVAPTAVAVSIDAAVPVSAVAPTAKAELPPLAEPVADLTPLVPLEPAFPLFPVVDLVLEPEAVPPMPRGRHLKKDYVLQS